MEFSKLSGQENKSNAWIYLWWPYSLKGWVSWSIKTRKGTFNAGAEGSPARISMDHQKGVFLGSTFWKELLCSNCDWKNGGRFFRVDGFPGSPQENGMQYRGKPNYEFVQRNLLNGDVGLGCLIAPFQQIGWLENKPIIVIEAPEHVGNLHRCLKAISIKNTHLNENYIYSRLFFDHGRITCDSRRLPKHWILPGLP